MFTEFMYIALAVCLLLGACSEDDLAYGTSFGALLGVTILIILLRILGMPEIMNLPEPLNCNRICNSHAPDWRSGLAWMVNRYSGYFEPVNPKAHEIAGCGAYSSWEGELDIEKLKKMAFRVNWKASIDFPYMGMFLPPVEVWRTFATSKEAAKDPWIQKLTCLKCRADIRSRWSWPRKEPQKHEWY